LEIEFSEQIKTRELFQEETEKKSRIITQNRPGDLVELGFNQRCSKPQPKGYAQPGQRKQIKIRAEAIYR
jgi:predicted SnoaL-like aldol condensation-catalyzing enzyme